MIHFQKEQSSCVAELGFNPGLMSLPCYHNASTTGVSSISKFTKMQMKKQLPRLLIHINQPWKNHGFHESVGERLGTPLKRTKGWKQQNSAKTTVQGKWQRGDWNPVQPPNHRKDDSDWEGERQGQGGRRERANGPVAESVGAWRGKQERKSTMSPLPHRPWPLLAVSCVLANSWPEKSGNHWFKEQLRGTLSRILFL